MKEMTKSEFTDMIKREAGKILDENRKGAACYLDEGITNIPFVPADFLHIIEERQPIMKVKEWLLKKQKKIKFELDKKSYGIDKEAEIIKGMTEEFKKIIEEEVQRAKLLKELSKDKLINREWIRKNI